jgi:hypothetical protein
MTDYTRDTLQNVVDGDVKLMWQKDQEYGRSWCKRGGTSATENVMRKVDRMTKQLEVNGWDIFKAMTAEGTSEGFCDTVRDLRCYLVLCEAYLLAHGDLPLQPRLEQAQPTKSISGCITPEDVPVATPNWNWNSDKFTSVSRTDETGQARPFGFDPENDVS